MNGIKRRYIDLYIPEASTRFELVTLPETNIAPEKGWLEYYFPIGFRPIFRCVLVSFREGINPPFFHLFSGSEEAPVQAQWRAL